MKQSSLASWTRLASLVRSQARGAYSRDLNLAQRITYVQVYTLAKLWYIAQVLQPQCVPTANYIGHYVVYMARRHFSCATINIA